MREKHGVLALNILASLRKFKAENSNKTYLSMLLDVNELIEREIRKTKIEIEIGGREQLETDGTELL